MTSLTSKPLSRMFSSNKLCNVTLAASNLSPEGPLLMSVAGLLGLDLEDDLVLDDDDLDPGLR